MTRSRAKRQFTAMIEILARSPHQVANAFVWGARRGVLMTRIDAPMFVKG